MKINCEICLTEFYAAPSRLAKGYGRYCTLKCSAKGHLKTKIELGLMKAPIQVDCPTCGKTFSRNICHTKKSKSGLLFCNKKCKDAAARLDGLVAIHPAHYGTGVDNYRRVALRLNKASCNRCGYNKHIEVLVVHHKDKNRLNGSIENLEVLCPTCHAEHHFFERGGRAGLLA